MAEKLTREYIVASLIVGAMLTISAAGAVEMNGITMLIMFVIVLTLATWLSCKEEGDEN